LFWMRIYHAENHIEVTINARWNGSAWQRDSLLHFAARLIIGRTELRFQQVSTSIAQPFNDSDWTGTSARVFGFDATAINFGEQFLSGREREVPSGPLTGYSAAEGEWGSTLANIGGGASFASGRLPASPSSITFTVKQQFNT